MKVKKLSHNRYLASDEITGEPVAHMIKTGSGRYSETKFSWHPHVRQMFPHANDPLYKIETAKGSTPESSGYRVNTAFGKLTNPEENQFETKPAGELESGEKLFDIHHRESGTKVLTVKTHPASVASMGEGGYREKVELHAVHISPNNLNTASKGVGGDANSLKRHAGIAANLYKIHTKGGPRFVGKESATGSSSNRRRVYTTTIKDPHEAINAYIKDSGQVESGLERTDVSPSMTILHNTDGTTNHIIRHDATNNTIAHSRSTYNYPSALDHVIEQVQE